MEIICVFCEKPIERGVIFKGEPYHETCLNRMQSDRAEDDLQAMFEKFKDIDTEALEDLYYQYVVEEDKAEYLHRCMEKAPWAVITRGLDSNDNADIQIDEFPSKTKLCNWLADRLYENFHEDGRHWEMDYVLRHGKIVSNWNNFNVRISLPKGV